MSERLIVIGFTPAELGTVVRLIRDHQETGEYFGNRDRYYRHVAALEAKVTLASEVLQKAVSR